MYQCGYISKLQCWVKKALKMLFSKEECHFFKVYKHAKQSYEVFIGTNVCKKQTNKQKIQKHIWEWWTRSTGEWVPKGRDRNGFRGHHLDLPVSSVHGLFQARILEQVAIFFSRGSSQPRDQTWVSCISRIGRQILYHWATWEAPTTIYKIDN